GVGSGERVVRRTALWLAPAVLGFVPLVFGAAASGTQRAQSAVVQMGARRPPGRFAAEALLPSVTRVALWTASFKWGGATSTRARPIRRRTRSRWICPTLVVLSLWITSGRCVAVGASRLGPVPLIPIRLVPVRPSVGALRMGTIGTLPARGVGVGGVAVLLFPVRLIRVGAVAIPVPLVRRPLPVGVGERGRALLRPGTASLPRNGRRQGLPRPGAGPRG